MGLCSYAKRRSGLHQETHRALIHASELGFEKIPSMKKRYQVVIVGGGPVGVALAVELGQRGLSCALVERRREPQRIPQGQNLTQRSVEHFYFWGVLDAVRAARMLPPEYPMSGIVAYRDLNSKHW